MDRAKAFTTFNPHGTPVIVINRVSDKRTCTGSVLSGEAFSRNGKVFSWVVGYANPINIDRLKPIRG